MQQGRIDIFISDREAKLNIIIENKIYAKLNNDLEEYWSYVENKEGFKGFDTIGVLLSLHPFPLPSSLGDKYININHRDWIGLIKSKNKAIEEKTLSSVYLNDFLNTMETLTKSEPMNDEAKFFFQNPKKITQIAATKEQGELYIENQLQIIAEKLGWAQFGSDKNWRNFWDDYEELKTYLTIVLDKLYSGESKVLIAIELYGDDIEKADGLEQLLIGNPQFSKMKTGQKGDAYFHFRYLEYSLDEDQLANFANFILDRIKEDFSEVLIKCIRHNYPEQGSFKWESNFLNL